MKPDLPAVRFGVLVRNVLIVSIVLTELVNAANACQCSNVSPSPCNSLSTPGVIFLGTVKSIENRPWSEFWSFSKTYSGMSWKDRLAMFRDEVIVNFSVEEIYNGDPARELSVRVTRFLGSCGFEYKPGELYFKKGEKYLVYAGLYGGPLLDKSNADGHLRTNHCSGTTLASNVTERIKAYRTLKGLQRPIVLGTYNLQPELNKKIPAGGQSVTFEPNVGTRLNATVQEDGSFLLTGVPPTTYTLAPTIAKGYRVGYGNGYRIKDSVPVNPETLNVGPNSCTELEVVALPDGRISGSVIDSNGRPLPGASIRVWRANDLTGLENSWWGKENDTRGRFTEGPLPPGHYVVGAYIWSAVQEQRLQQGQDVKPSLWFYPGVSRPERAKIITLGFAEHRGGIQIRVRKTSQAPQVDGRLAIHRNFTH
jgi:hypothetical protein